MAPPVPYTILYVDDEAALLEITKLFLERAGDITVDTTTNPLEAYEMIMTGRYDVIVSDYQMPGMDGIVLLKQVRANGSQVPFIIFTGKGREEVAIEALNSGADFYLQKGGDPKAQFTELANAVRQLAGRQRAEVAVCRTKEMLQKTESLAHLGSWMLDCRTGQLTWSDETYRIFNRTPGECAMTYEAFLSAIHPDDRAIVDAMYLNSLVDGKDFYTIEHRLICTDTGEVRYVIELCEHLRDESGQIVHSRGLVHDITEHKLAELELLRKHEELQAAHEELAATEEELRASFDDLAGRQRQIQESERRLADIIDFLPDATLVVDESGCVIAWNRAIEKMTGIPKAEMLGQSEVPLHEGARSILIDCILRPDGATDYPYDIQTIDGEIFEATVDLAHLDGRDVTLMIRVSPLYDQEGRRIGAIEIIRDITANAAMERKIERHVAELSRQTNRLAVANKKLSLMNSITRHDILNQLTIFLANLSFVREARDSQDISWYLSRMEDAADRIGRQIEFTRDYASLGIQTPEWQHISSVVRSAASGGLPIEDESGDLAVYADPMLTRAFANLMDNTMRHGESASRVRVRYLLEESGDLTLVWEDDGIGISPDEKKLIFRRGFGKNTGFGLFLIREILEITGITITETGEHREGARFEMHVPDGMYRVPTTPAS
jgi:PAS domain S-box-containing protein